MHTRLFPLLLSALAVCTVACKPTAYPPAQSNPGFPPLPNPPPLNHAQRTGVVTPTFTVAEFIAAQGRFAKRPIYTAGNKIVTTRSADGRAAEDQTNVKICVDNTELMAITWWGALPNMGFGYPFGPIPDKPATYAFDEKRGITTFSKPYLLTNRTEAVFTYTLKPLSNSCVELSWDTGSDATVNLWIIPAADRYRNKRHAIGKTELIQHDRDTLINKLAKNQTCIGDYHYDIDAPLKGFTLKLGETTGHYEEKLECFPKSPDRYASIYRVDSAQSRSKGRLVIDLGCVELADEKSPPPVGNIDFWKEDQTHVPQRPTHNIMPNPSFEQGLRYWTWVGGGATYVKTNLPKWSIVTEAHSGKHALMIGALNNGPSICSMPIALESGKTYTLSFYARTVKEPRGSLRVAIGNAARGGSLSDRIWGDNDTKASHFEITHDWKRYARTFTADHAGFRVFLEGWDVLLDSLQLEQADRPTTYVSAPIEANFITANPDNDLILGQAPQAGLSLVGEPRQKGTLAVTIENGYREVNLSTNLVVTLDERGTLWQPIPLPQQLGQGIFVVKTTTHVEGYPDYTEFYRFSIMTPLYNQHATASLMATLVNNAWRVSRGEDLARKYRDWGWGGTTWISMSDCLKNPLVEQTLTTYGIQNWQTAVGDYLMRLDDEHPGASPFKHLGNHHQTLYDQPEITPALEQYVETQTEAVLRRLPTRIFPYVSYGNEEESSRYVGKGDFSAYFKLQSAAARGARKAGVKCTPTSGTSGYNLLRGYEPYEGYLKTAREHHFAYDALAVHPYGSIDKGLLSTSDLDEEAARLIEQGKRYGYTDATPILFTELFNIPETYIPAWNAGDSYDAYSAGKATYDFGRREFLQAMSAMRLYIICMKYWPRITCANIWVSSPYIDLHLTPILLCKTVNTLGHALSNPIFVDDIRPGPGIRGYGFKKADGSGVVALWCTRHAVESGRQPAPVLAVRFDQPVQFMDAMGNPRSAQPDKDGYTLIPVTPAPLFISGPNPDALIRAMQNAESTGGESALSIAFIPQRDRRVNAHLTNLTGRKQAGTLQINEAPLPYALDPKAAMTLPVPVAAAQTGRLSSWNYTYRLVPSTGEPRTGIWKMDYFVVPKTPAQPINWDAIEPLALTNYFFGKTPAYPVMPKDLSATAKFAWDTTNLYIKIDIRDDQHVEFPEVWLSPKALQCLWNHDLAVEVYVDTGANGRKAAEACFDNDDYRYDFCKPKAGQDGRGMVYRFREVYHQLADGVNMATKQEAAENIGNDWKQTANGASVVITFPQRYIEPLMLKPGFLAGVGLFIHDFDSATDRTRYKGLSNATEPGLHCDNHPERWPLMLLGD